MKRKKAIFVILSIISIILLCNLTDYLRVKSNKKPIFAFPITTYKDGGSIEYFGLGYKVIKCNTLSGDKSAHFGFYNINIEKCKNESFEFDDDNELLPIANRKSTGTANYLFSFKTSYYDNDLEIRKLLDTLELNSYGHYTLEYQLSNGFHELIIHYYEVEGWGNILEQSDVLTQKSALILALLDNVDKITWKTGLDKSYSVTMNDLKEYGDIKEYGLSEQNFNFLLKKLGYEEEPITMNITALTPSSLTLTIQNHTDNSYSYGASFGVEKYENGKWISVEGMPDTFIMIAYTLNGKETVEKQYSWDIKLDSGEYRIIKNFDEIISNSDFRFEKKYYVSAQFTIE
ncbi:MAG: DUF4825 domain-containing protein [Bacilli bacterium]|nr:DUF4825 domain-containing protein [Bacilli bacterium]